MRKEFRMEYLRKIHGRYQKADRREKLQMLDEFCQICHYHRKYAIRLLNSPLPGKSKLVRSKRYKYGSDVIAVLTAIWEASGYLWSQRLKVALAMWIPWARRHCRVTPQIEKKLLAMGTATMDRRLKDRKIRLKRRIYGTTRPGTLLKHQIPIKTDSWDAKVPGFLEVDLVSHSGQSSDGEFIHSLNTVDIQTTWTEARAVWSKGQMGVIDAFTDIEEALPFRMRGISFKKIQRTSCPAIRPQAFEILDEKRAKAYHHAHDYLQNAKTLLEKCGDAATWSSLVMDVRREHRLKSSFMPGFEKIVAGDGSPREPTFKERIAKRLDQGSGSD